MSRVTSAVVTAAMALGIGCAQPKNLSQEFGIGAYVDSLRAIDSHAHPMRFVAQGAPADSEFDALPLDAIPPFAVPWRMGLDNPQWKFAQHDLFGVAITDTGAVYQAALTKARDGVVAAQGEKFPSWALDRAGIDVMLANRIAMGPGLTAPRFRWVSFADPLMLPLDLSGETARTPDAKGLYPKEAKLLARYLTDLGLKRVPATLEAFVATVLRPTLERQKAGGAVAVKFEAAYLRSLAFDPPDPAAAARIYARYAGGGVPSSSDYKVVEDYLFRVICREAGRLGLAVQIHALEGFGGYYSAAGSAPHLLESAVTDSTLRGTNFVIVHGGWPRIAETQALLSRANVYTDISAMVLLVEPSRLAGVLTQWLGEWPDKVLFGTDAFDGGPAQGWAEVARVGSTTARGALTAALNTLIEGGTVDPARARVVAKMVMRDNAIAAYHLTVN